MIFDQKNFFTNVISSGLIILGIILNPSFYGELLTTTGLFALSGSVTNWLAIYMLFEKIPFLYGSGVIPMQFEAFKLGMKNLIMGQFFTPANISNFLDQSISKLDANYIYDKIATKINYNDIFSGLTEVIMQSSFAGMLAMFGGVTALEPLREPIANKFREMLQNIIQQIDVHKLLNNDLGLHDSIEIIVDARLAELTPNMVKEIIQEMIHKHLGWLVVWGGVFGGMIGAAYSLVLHYV
jgi:uncharacterized membrane protein YheB (UPF0754 family)